MRRYLLRITPPPSAALHSTLVRALTSRSITSRAMAEAAGRPYLRPVYEPARQGDVPHLYPHIGRARDVLGYRPLVEFEPGLKETLRWYLEYGFIRGRGGWTLT